MNQAIAQVRELFLSMTPAARVTAALLAGVIVVSIGLLVQQQGAGPDEYLFNGQVLQPEDAVRVEAAISKAGLSGWDSSGNRIKVPRGQKASYLAAIAAENALPPNFHTLLEDALDLGPFVDDKTRRERLKAAREQQLSMIIRSMEGIEDAKVIYDVVEARGLARTSHASATVSVRSRPGEAIPPKQLKSIRNAVAGAVGNLKPEDVVVVNLGEGGLLAEEVSAESFDTPYYQHRVAYEQLMKDRILKLLEIPGVRVDVSAELSHELTNEAHTVTTTEPVTLRRTQQEKISESQHPANGGRPGLVANGPGATTDAVAEAPMKDSLSDITSEEANFIPTTNELVTKAGLVPEHVRVAVAVPNEYVVDMYRERQRRRGEDPTKPLPADFDSVTLDLYQKEVKSQVSNLIEPLLPKEINKTNFENVQVSFFESLTPEPLEPVPATSEALAWASQNFSTLTMGGIALVGLVMLRSLVKGIPAPEPGTSAEAPVLQLHRGDSQSERSPLQPADSDEDEEEQRPRLKLKKGKSLRDELTTIVREDPDAAANILRSWISNAG